MARFTASHVIPSVLGPNPDPGPRMTSEGENTLIPSFGSLNFGALDCLLI